jgi:hypothetical protein
MSIIDAEREMRLVTPAETVQDQVERGNVLSFAEAAELSHGPYDTDEQHLQRIEYARRLAETMVPGASVLHRVNSLEVHGGTLIDLPEVLLVPRGNDFELALGYKLDAGLDEYTGYMTFNSLIAGTRPGFSPKDYANMPVLIAGDQDVSNYALQTYARQRILENIPGGVPWDDMSPLTELRVYGALAHTNVRLKDVLPANQTRALRERLLADLENPALKHVAPENFWALVGVDDTGTERLQEEIHARRAAEKRTKRKRIMHSLGRVTSFLY